MEVRDVRSGLHLLFDYRLGRQNAPPVQGVFIPFANLRTCSPPAAGPAANEGLVIAGTREGKLEKERERESASLVNLLWSEVNPTQPGSTSPSLFAGTLGAPIRICAMNRADCETIPVCVQKARDNGHPARVSGQKLQPMILQIASVDPHGNETAPALPARRYTGQGSYQNAAVVLLIGKWVSKALAKLEDSAERVEKMSVDRHLNLSLRCAAGEQ
jgi:hypothetical protein